MPGAEEFVCSACQTPPPVPEPEGVVPPSGPSHITKEASTTTHQVSLQVPEDLTMPPLEDTYLPGAMTLFDLSTLESLVMTISHTPVIG